VAAYHRDGFLTLNRRVIPADELADAERHIDAIFLDRTSLSRQSTHGTIQASPLPSLVDVIRGATVLDPELTRHPVVERTREIACELLGVQRVWFHFDHVFYKHSGAHSKIEWHQDGAYSRSKMIGRAVHMWIPFQDVTEESGCMNYVPGSHGKGLQIHQVIERNDGLIFRMTNVDDALAVACPVDAGGLLCHTPTTLHASGLNQGGEIRKAWVVQFGVGPWVALRTITRPLLTKAVRLQEAVSRTAGLQYRSRVGSRLDAPPFPR